MGQDVVFQLTGCAEPDEFLQDLQKGRTCLSMRSYKVLLTHSTVDNAVYANLNIVHAGAPTLPSFSQPEYTNPHGLMVAEIRHLAKNQCGNMIPGIKEMPVSAELVLAVLQGTNDAECQWRGKLYMFVSRWFRTLSARQTLRDFKLGCLHCLLRVGLIWLPSFRPALDHCSQPVRKKKGRHNACRMLHWLT